MIKKISVGFLAALLLAGAFGFGALNRAEAQDITLAQLVEFLINIGVISADKVSLARAFVSGGATSSQAPATTSDPGSLMVTYPTANSSFSAGGQISVAFSHPAAGIQYDVQLRGRAYSYDLGTMTGTSADQNKGSFTLPSSIPSDAGPFNIVIMSGSSDLAASPSFYVSSTKSYQPSNGASFGDDATVSVTGSPTLALTYDYSNKEALLTATFNASVTAGSNGAQLYIDGADVRFIDQSGKQANTNSNRTSLTLLSRADQTTDGFNRHFAVIPAGQTVNVQVVGTINPRTMFAGNYHATIGLYANVGDSQGTLNPLIPSNNQTNWKSIVGETTPYITSVTNTVAPGGTLSIYGQRLALVTAWIDGAPIAGGGPMNPSNGTAFSVIVPTSLSVGNHTLVLKDSNGQASNPAGFNISGESSQQSLKYDMPITSPATNDQLSLSGNTAVNWTYPNDVAGKQIQFAARLVTPSQLANVSPSNLPGVVFYQSVNNEPTISSYNSLRAGIFLQPNLKNVSPGQYNVLLTAYDPQTGITHAGVSGQFALTDASTVIQPSISPTVSLASSPSLSLSYDYSNNESSLTGSATVNVHAGSSDVLVRGVYMSLKENTGVVAPHGLLPNGNSSTFTAGGDAEQTTASDSQGNSVSVWRIRAGQTGVFQTRLAANPQLMYPGNYGAFVSYVATLENGTYTSIPFSSSDSSYVTILGEKAGGASVTGSQTMTPSNQTVASGQGATLNFTYPSNTVRATLYISCPSGVGLGASKGNITDCNTYADVTNARYAMFQVINNTSAPANVVPNYYVYTSDNPNYAKGVSVQITVSPAPTVAAQPLSATCKGSAIPSSNNISWSASATGGAGAYSYQWSAYNDVNNYGEGSTQSSAVVIMYGSSGTKQAVARVSDGTNTVSATCSETIPPVTSSAQSGSNEASVFFGADQLVNLIKALR